MRSTPTPALNKPLVDDDYTDLAPDICRQRIVIEGIPNRAITDDDITRYLSNLSVELDMVQLGHVATHQSPLYGWAGWIHWETSGAHFYAWERLEDETPFLFFSVDIYTCKPFDPDTAISYTQQFFGAEVITAKNF